MRISTDMAVAIAMPNIDAAFPHVEGNIASHAYNVTHDGELDGIGLGWKGQEASTGFLCSIVSAVDETWEEFADSVHNGAHPQQYWDAMRNDGRDHEIADGCVPIYTHALLDAAIELQRTSVDSDALDSVLNEDEGGLSVSMERIAQVSLYDLAFWMVHSLMNQLIANAMRDDA